MREKISTDEFFYKIDFTIPYIQNFKSMIEFTEVFFKDDLDVDNFDSVIEFPQMPTRIYIYLFASLLLKYQVKNVQKEGQIDELNSNGNKSKGHSEYLT